MKIKMVVFDIDGVMTDGKKYMDGCGTELKALQLKDLDAIGLMKDNGYILGCVSGEDTPFSRQIAGMDKLDFAILGCKEKETALEEQISYYDLAYENVCYIGDGKYDIPVLEKAGLSVCPEDAIEEVKKVSDVVLKRRGGDACLAELYTLLENHRECDNNLESFDQRVDAVMTERMSEHKALLDSILQDDTFLRKIQRSIWMITAAYEHGGGLFLCGNGGSAADAQHLAAELVGRFYLERPAWSAEALTTNTSILTAIANDYNYDAIFARQLEAKAKRGDVLVGFTTSGASKNIVTAFGKAREIGIRTILFTGRIRGNEEILGLTDCLLDIPSRNTPRIQEMHILIGHLICEIVEQHLTKYKG